MGKGGHGAGASRGWSKANAVGGEEKLTSTGERLLGFKSGGWQGGSRSWSEERSAVSEGAYGRGGSERGTEGGSEAANRHVGAGTPRLEPLLSAVSD